MPYIVTCWIQSKRVIRHLILSERIFCVCTITQTLRHDRLRKCVTTGIIRCHRKQSKLKQLWNLSILNVLFYCKFFSFRYIRCIVIFRNLSSLLRCFFCFSLRRHCQWRLDSSHWQHYFPFCVSSPPDTVNNDRILV